MLSVNQIEVLLSVDTQVRIFREDHVIPDGVTRNQTALLRDLKFGAEANRNIRLDQRPDRSKEGREEYVHGCSLQTPFIQDG